MKDYEFWIRYKFGTGWNYEFKGVSDYERKIEVLEDVRREVGDLIDYNKRLIGERK